MPGKLFSKRKNSRSLPTPKMKIKRFRTHAEPNVYSHRPVIVMTLDLAELNDRTIGDVPGFAENLSRLLTDASGDAANMFAEQLNAETDFVRALKMIAAELLDRADVGTRRGATQFTGEKGVYHVALEFTSEKAAEFLLAATVELIDALAANGDFPLAEKIAEARSIAAANEPDASVKQLTEAAEKRGIPWTFDREKSALRFGYGKNARFVPLDSIGENHLTIEKLYPSEAESRIPIVAITGTNGKTTVTRMTAHILRETGLNIGTATTDGILFNGESIQSGDTTGPASARKILNDERVDIAVLETARGGIVRRGLGWHWADVGVVTNITEDHIGQDGIESLEDLVWIKSLIAERVRENGTLILNADDEQSSKLIYRRAVARVPKKIVYFSMSEENPIVREHLRNGETAYFVKGRSIVEASGENSIEIVRIENIPVTIGGTAEFQIQNAMAASAVCRALKMSPEKIAHALGTFRSDAHNAGRNNFYRVGKGYALIDYGHNPQAFEAICRMTARWTDKRTVGIVSVPGDRSDDLIKKAGRIAVAGFDRVIIKGDHNLRGRERGEIAEMLEQIAAEIGKRSDCEVVLNAEDAFEREIANIKENEVVVFFYEKLEPVLKTLQKHNAVPATSF